MPGGPRGPDGPRGSAGPSAGTGPGGPQAASLTHGAVGRLVVALGTATLLQWLGAFAIAPILPLYLEERDVSAGGVGVVMAAFFLGALLSQYPAGLATTTRGHRPVLVAGLVAYAVGCAGLIVSPGIMCDTAMRVLQGAGAGAFEVAVLTAIAATVPPDLTGRAVSAVYTGQIAGTAIGPLLGGLAGEQRMDLLFLGAGVAAAVASVPVLVLLRPDGPGHAPALSVASTGSDASAVGPTAGGGAGVPGGRAGGAEAVAAVAAVAVHRDGSPGHAGRRAPAWASRRRTWSPLAVVGPGIEGLLLVAAVNGLAVGTYETCWSLLLTDRGISTELVGLSFTLFSLPYIVCAMPAGWLADHNDRRWLVVAATATTGVTVATYSFIGSFWLIVLVSCAEAIALAVSFPSAQSLLAQESGPGGAGRAQGLFTTTQTAATAGAALTSGALYAANAHLPFVLTAVAALAVAGSLPWLWRRVRGTVVPAAVPSGAVPAGAVPAASTGPAGGALASHLITR
ncbi:MULTISPECIES: MFS transporter [unclassified Parafrankia]|uniref:MFS transporter n=1 Tax=Parafrankia sp. BMG5.11 TaxID=222540 RepID=UPI000DD2C6AC|nr:MFS transporter [Parafrankia sp. BMG5.11]